MIRDKKTQLYIIIISFLLTAFQGTVCAQKRHASYDEYIEQYHTLAIKHMEKYGIPASITLAQGLLESGAGKSELARNSRNHFGIKCHSNWEGDRVFRKDDGPNDCFRVYPSVDDSYDDHSRFLAERKRYSELFAYDITDYKKWAKGLQKCGYATDKGYANKLIKIIEDYELYRYDREASKRPDKPGGKNPQVVPNDPLLSTMSIKSDRVINKKQGLTYIVVKEYDTIEQIAFDTDRKLKDILEYNDIPADFPLQEGDIIYLQKKKKKADKPFFDHVVQVGESMHSISQHYGIRVSSLYKLNKKNGEYIPEEGDVLRLR